MATQAKIGGITPWYGAKRDARLLAPIMAEIGKPKFLADVFCGSCAVSLAASGLASVHLVNDLHDDLALLALVLADPFGSLELYERAARMVFSEALFEHAVQTLETKKAATAERAAAYLYASWAGHNGFAGTDVARRFNVRFSASGGGPARRWRSVIESIPWWHEAMRTWTILNRDAFDVLESLVDDPGTVIYCDPPYYDRTRSNARYVHEFDHGDEGDPLFGAKRVNHHALLRQALGRFVCAKVIISYYDHPYIRNLYQGWRFVENTQSKRVAQATRGERSADSEAPEVIICNR